MFRRFILAAVVAAIALGGLIACNGDKSPTDPIEDQERAAWCETYAERCSWFTEVTVFARGSTSGISGARVKMTSNVTSASKSFSTRQDGVSEQIRWDLYVPSGTFAMTIEPPSGSGLTWQPWDRAAERPTCTAHESVDRGMICRVVAELTPNGIGEAAR